MPAYTTRKFLALVSVSVVISLVVLSLAPFALNRAFPVTWAYYQLVGGDADSCPPYYICSPPGFPEWGRLNHTLVITGNTVEAYLEVLATEEPKPSPANVTVGFTFWPPDYLVPNVTGGDLEWRGELHNGGSIRIRSSFQLIQDGKYFIGGYAVSTAQPPDYSTFGMRAPFYLRVQSGLVTRVSDTPEPLDSTNPLEARCFANCPP